jgi:hypothetical protein
MEHFESYAGLVILAFALTELIKSQIAWFNNGIWAIALLVIVSVALTGLGVLTNVGVFEGLTFWEAILQVTLAAIGLAAFSYDTLKAIRKNFKK